MAARNYQPTMRRLARLLSVFITRYNEQIDAGATPEQAAAVATALAALNDLLSALGTGGGT